ncbi:MAG: serine/threonine protein kinase [Bdellovibrionales bacterium]|nr:serine/threonine protein kinase [Bdellovibrionales bacterium]
MSTHSFFALTPDRVLDAVESALDALRCGRRATGRSQALNSIENRVYDIELEDGSSVVAKFYRPGRWVAEQILEEHAFMARLLQAEVPVVPPLVLHPGPSSRLVDPSAPTLALSPDNIFFALFPKVRARIRDELNDSQLEILGRFVARLHAVGAGWKGRTTRLTLDAETFGYASIRSLAELNFLHDNMGQRYRIVAERLLNHIAPRLKHLPMHRIHGDCHLGNVLWDDDRPFFVDFDDMLVGPPVQDIWMIIRGDDAEARGQRDILVDAYQEMRAFDRETLKLVEPLRVLRLIHYSAWIARRWEDPAFPRMFPTFGTDAWWQSEIEALSQVEQLL